MSIDKNKIAIISLSAGCFLFLCLTIMFYNIKETEKHGKNMLQNKLDDITITKHKLEKELESADALMEDLRSKVKAKEDEALSITKKLNEEKDMSSKNLSELKAREDEIRTLKSQLEDEIGNKKALAADMEKIKNENTKVKTDLEKEAKEKEEMDKKMKETAAKEGVSLGTVVVDQYR